MKLREREKQCSNILLPPKKEEVNSENLRLVSKTKLD